jgi:adenylate cyclase
MAEGVGDGNAGGGALRVFISYASNDAAAAAALVDALERHGIPCWIAPRNVKAGALYADAIVRAISGARAFVLVLSESAIASSHVSKEIERASSKKRPIIALRIDGAPLTPALEYFLSESQWVEAQAGNTDAAYIRLIDAIREPTQTAPQSPVVVAAATPAGTASVAHPESRGNRILLASALVVVALALAALLADKIWLSRHVTTGESIARETPSLASTGPTISDKSVAVLPFIDMSEKKDEEYFADGMAEEIIDLLVKVPELKVSARTSSFYFKGKSTKIPEIAAELGVAHVLEGSVRKSGSHLRVTAQLVSADTGYHLWSETYDRQLEDVFKTQDEIADAVVAALKLKLAPGQQSTSSHRTSNPDAYNQYLLGRQFFEGFNLDGFRRAVDSYRKAIQLDPNYAAAYAELAISEFYVANNSGDTTEKQQALATADKAVALAPNEADGYAVRGFLRFIFAWDWTGAQSDFAKALALNPGDNRFQRRYGALLGTLGRLPESIVVLKKATELDPLSSLTWTVFGSYLIANRQFAAADAALRRALEIQPDSDFALDQLGTLQLLTDNPTEALTTFRKHGGDRFSLMGIAMAEHSLGHVKESQHALDEAIAQHAQDFAYGIAEVYAWRGENDKAFAWLRRAFQQRDGGLCDVKDDVLLTSLRSDDRFSAMLRKMQLPE